MGSIPAGDAKKATFSNVAYHFLGVHMSNQKPKRHHYIPQFILRNFNDEKSQVNYWNIETKTLEKRNTKKLHLVKS